MSGFEIVVLLFGVMVIAGKALRQIGHPSSIQQLEASRERWVKSYKAKCAYAARLQDRIQQLEDENEQLMDQNWPWEWQVATKEKERRQAAEACIKQLENERDAYEAAQNERDALDRVWCDKAEARIEQLEDLLALSKQDEADAVEGEQQALDRIKQLEEDLAI